jgi:polyhydroxyalkanoate synthesis regulator phasin
MKLIEKFLYYSVGFASETANKLTKLMQKLIEQNKISEDEAQTFLDDYAKKIDDMTQKFDQKLEDFVKKDLQEFNYITKDQIKKIEQRIDKINNFLDSKLEEKTIAEK